MRLKKIRKYNYVIVPLLLSLATLYLLVYYSPWGGRNYFQLQDELERLNSELASLQQQNQQLNSEIAKLKENTKYIEEVARKQFGLLKKNEVIFEFKKEP